MLVRSTNDSQLVDRLADWEKLARIYPTVAVESDTDAWMAVLSLTKYCSTGRFLYCCVIKRLIDLIMAILLMLMLSPLFLIIALAIWLETRSQPIFRQTRIGRNNEPFVIYKFCTMIPDRRTANLPFEGKDRRKTHKSPNDPRVTRIGHFLRATSLDELPQLINIIRGDMSFIGPRPELPGIVRSYAPWQHQRHLVTPGLTGWWQIQGRSDLPMHEHTELDIYYVINFSWSLDLRIVLHTIAILLLRTGAF